MLSLIVLSRIFFYKLTLILSYLVRKIGQHLLNGGGGGGGEVAATAPAPSLCLILEPRR